MSHLEMREDEKAWPLAEAGADGMVLPLAEAGARWVRCSNYRVEIAAVGIKNLEYLANRNSSVTVRTPIH